MLSQSLLLLCSAEQFTYFWIQSNSLWPRCTAFLQKQTGLHAPWRCMQTGPYQKVLLIDFNGSAVLLVWYFRHVGNQSILSPHLSHPDWSVAITSLHVPSFCIFQCLNALNVSFWAFLLADSLGWLFCFLYKWCHALQTTFTVGPSIYNGFAQYL